MLGAREAVERHYARPSDLAEALRLRGQGAQIIAGGTDFYPVRVGRPLYDRDIAGVLDLTGLADLNGISDQGGFHRIGALTTWTTLAEAALPAQFDCLQAAAREVGGRQIQNRGTIGGNLCNASPAADGVPALLALGAEIELLSAAGARRLPLGDFILGPRQTALRADEILAAILVPKPQGAATSAFLKLGARKYLVISIVMAAGVARHRRRPHRRGAHRAWRLLAGGAAPAGAGGGAARTIRRRTISRPWRRRIIWPNWRRSTMCEPAPNTARRRR